MLALVLLTSAKYGAYNVHSCMSYQGGDGAAEETATSNPLRGQKNASPRWSSVIDLIMCANNFLMHIYYIYGTIQSLSLILLGLSAGGTSIPPADTSPR